MGIKIIEKKYPLNFEQKMLWDLINQNIEARKAYNDTLLVMFKGKLDIEKLKESIGVLIRRHGSLRTTFDASGCNHVVLPYEKVDIPITSGKFQLYEQKVRALERCLSESTNYVFNLSGEPLYKFSLFKWEEDIVFLIITGVNIVTDGIGFSVIVDDLSKIYVNKNIQSPMQHSEIFALYDQYLDKTFENSGFWKKLLLDRPLRRIEFPFAKKRPTIMSFQGSHLQFEIEAKLTKNIHEFCHANRLTFFIALFSAFCLTVHKLCRLQDFIIGVPFSKRPTKESYTCVGFCITILPLRSFISSGDTLKSYLKEMRNITMNAYENMYADDINAVMQNVPFKIDMSTPLFFDVLFNLEKSTKAIDFGESVQAEVTGLNSPYFNIKIDNKKIPIQLSTGHAQFDLTINIIESDGVCSIAFEYNTDILTASDLGKIKDSYIHTLSLLNNSHLESNLKYLIGLG